MGQMTHFITCGGLVRRQKNSGKIYMLKFKKKLKINLAMKSEMMLGILPNNIERTSQDLFRYMLTSARIQWQENRKWKNSQPLRIGKSE